MNSTFRMVVVPPEATGDIHTRIIEEAVRRCIVEDSIKEGMCIIDGSLDLLKVSVQQQRDFHNSCNLRPSDCLEIDPHTEVVERD